MKIDSVEMNIFSEVSVRTAKSKGMLDYVDAASLLWRLELEGVDVGSRYLNSLALSMFHILIFWWHDLIPIEKHLDDHVIVFNDVHFGPALSRRGDVEQERRLRESMTNFVT